MTSIVHLPEHATFEGPIAEDRRREIEQTLLAAIRRAVLTVRAGSDTAVRARPDRRRTDPGEVGEPLDPARFDEGGGVYRVPSYDLAGELTDVQLLEHIPRAAAVYGVMDGPSRLDGKLILAMTGNRYVFLRSPRYAVSSSLTLAYSFGLTLFGASSFAILQGPWGQPLTQYLTVGTDPGIDDADLGSAGRLMHAPTEEGQEGKQVEVAGEMVMAWASILVPSVETDLGTYVLRGFVTRDRQIRYANLLQAREWHAQVQVEAVEGVQTPGSAEARGLLFDDVDKLVDEFEGGDDKNLQKAADYLTRFDSNAFSLVPWDRKVKYLKVLLAAWTWQEQERAVVQIFKSLRSDSEVDAVVAELKRAGRYDQLFDDLDDELYDLLVTVGERFPKDRSPLTLAGLVALLNSLGAFPHTPADVLGQAVLGPADVLVAPTRLLDEAHDAAMGLVRFGVDLGESLITIFTDPDKVVQGIGAMVQLLVKLQLASFGYPPAVLEIGKMLEGLGQKVLAGMRGADRLGAGEKVTRRLKWRLVWEIASLFIGIGEVKAVIQGAGLGEKLAGVLRFLSILVRIGEVVDAEADGVRLARLAALLKEERALITSVEEAAELLSHLPEDDVRKLGRLLSAFDLKEGETLADLAARSPRLHAAVEDAAAKAEVLKTLASKGAGLNEEAVAAFQRLVGGDGLEVGAARKVVDAIPSGEGARFAAALERVPLPRLTAEARAALLETLAGSAKQMDAVTRLGFDSFASVYRRASGRAGTVDGYLAAIEKLETRLGGEGKQAEFRRLLDALEQDRPAAWLAVENERRLLAGERAIGEWADLLSGSPKAQSALDKLLRGRGDRVVDSLIDQLAGDRGLISDPEVVLTLEKLDELGPRELDGVFELQRYLDRGEQLPLWDEILFTEDARRRELLEIIGELRDPANPGRVVVRDGMAEVLQAALRERNVQGGLAHFQAIRGLLRDFPGASFRLEVTRLSGGWREVDIVMDVAGRQVDVEVKGYQVTTGLGHVRRQIAKDLRRHLGDTGGPFSDMLWRFADPAYAANFPTVEQLFLDELGKLGLSPADLASAQTALRARFTAPAPWRLIDVLR
jgi:hypothetical protein